MSKVKVAINGFGTIGKRVADAVQMQKDMEIVGVSKTKPNFEAFTALNKGYSIYAPIDKIKDMERVNKYFRFHRGYGTGCRYSS